MLIAQGFKNLHNLVRKALSFYHFNLLNERTLPPLKVGGNPLLDEIYSFTFKPLVFMVLFFVVVVA